MRFFGSSLEDRPVYTPSDCFETFPFPPDWESNASLEQAGREYYEYRAALMVRNDEGLTKTYNRFHDPEEKSPDILRLRELHTAMDRAVLDAYGWHKIPTACEFLLDYEEDDESLEPGKKASKKKKPWRYRWPDEIRDEVLAKLLALNAERHAEEIAEENAQGMRRAKKVTKNVAKKKATKSSKPKVAPMPDFAFVADLDLPAWAKKLPEFTYEISNPKRTAAAVPLAFYRALIPALVQEAGGSLPLDVLYDSVSRLSDLDALTTQCDRVPSKVIKKWKSTFREPLDPNAFGSALESAVEKADIVRLVGTSENLELRLVKDSPVQLAWLRLDAQILLTAEASAMASVKAVPKVPADLRTKLISFLKSA